MGQHLDLPTPLIYLSLETIRSLFSPASHLSSKALHLSKVVRQGQETCFMMISTKDWRLLPGTSFRTSNAQCMADRHAWDGHWDFMPGTSVCSSKEMMVVTVTQAPFLWWPTQPLDRCPQSSPSLTLILFFGYWTTHSFSWRVKLPGPSLWPREWWWSSDPALGRQYRTWDFKVLELSLLRLVRSSFRDFLIVFEVHGC